ncbi:MAG: hypothetical protein HUU20_27675 [Pirellulales bacterium]|nr:hypothetical protein [Pirellulales bacterium]
MRLFGLSLIVAAVVLNLLYCVWVSPLDYPYPPEGQILGCAYMKSPDQMPVTEAGFWGLVVPISMIGAGLSLLFSRQPRVVQEKKIDRIK